MKRRLKALIRARRGTEHVGASYRSPRPLSEETKERLRSVVKPASSIGALARPAWDSTPSVARRHHNEGPRRDLLARLLCGLGFYCPGRRPGGGGDFGQRVRRGARHVVRAARRSTKATRK